MTKEEHLTRARARLLTLLERYGYHREAPPTFERSPYGGWPYYREPPSVDCDEEKPIRVFIYQAHLWIVHGRCLSSTLTNYREHQEEQLKAMIPLIGRLDAQAIYDPGERDRNGPWLRIYL